MVKKNRGNVGRPRIADSVHKMQITISEETFQSLKAFSEYQGDILPSALVRELLNDLVPTLNAVVDAHRKAEMGIKDAFVNLGEGLLQETIDDGVKIKEGLLSDDKK